MNRIYPVILIILILAAPFVIQGQDGIQFSAAVNKTTTVQYGDLQLTIPAGAAAQPMTVTTTSLNLTGIQRPFGFMQISSTTYSFGPEGLVFGPNKSLDFKLKINSALIPKGYSPASVRLFYINRQKSCLEEVRDQSVNLQTGVLEAKLEHYSEYVPGVVGSWDGKGLNPFIDYVTKGEESVCLNGLKLSINSQVLSLPGRGGLDLKLNRVYNNSYTYNYANDPFSISPKFYWDLPHYSNHQLCLPGGASYSPSHPIAANGNGTICTYDEGIVFTVYNPDSTTPVIYLSDGTSIEVGDDYQRITDTKGNSLRYNFTNFNPTNYGDPVYKLTSIIDSTGRQFNLSYEYESYGSYETALCLTRVEQVIPGNSPKTILTRSMTMSDYPYTYSESFSDAANRTITYHVNKGDQYHPDIEAHDVKRIDYYNGVHSEYTYLRDSGEGEFRVATQKFFYPNAGSPYRTVSYTKNGSEGSTTVNEPTCNKKLYFTGEGHTSDEYTYDLSNKPQKYINYTYPRILLYQPKDGKYDFESSRPTQVITAYGKNDGTFGVSSTCQYSYDDFGNTTMIKDPYGNYTYMAYSNTNSEKNLHDNINIWYENARYPTGPSAEIHNLLLTKATFVNNPVNGANQLKQSHFKYNSPGTLQKENVVYDGPGGRTTLDTCYEYDSYGNLTLKRDANGNELRFEYSSLYNYAYPTRVYLTGGTTLATYEYDLNTGRKITATDPKGNIFRYTYDLIGRLASEKLDNPDPNVGVERTLTYDDQNNIVYLTFGNNTTQQDGKIVFDALFGKPTKIKRKLNGNWTTLKLFSYDTSGRLYTETDGLGHTSTHNYDPLNREILTRLPDGATTTQTWDDRKLTITDANNVPKNMTYDLLDRLVQVDEQPDINTTYTTTYTYDSDSHLVRTINPRGAKIKNSYDNLGRLIQSDYPAQDANRLTPESFTYDNIGNLLTKTGANGTKSIVYDFICGEYKIKTINEPSRSISYTYDPNGNLLTQICPGVTYTYSNYDARNRVHNFSAQIEGNYFNFSYNYDLYGRMTLLTYPGRSNPVTYQYDDLDRLATIPGFINTPCSYDLDNKLTEMDYVNGIKNMYNYDVNDRVTRIQAGNGTNLLDLNYTYDPVSNITRINNDYYAYDWLNRLTWTGNTPTQQTLGATGTSWTYDGAGNRTGQQKYANNQLTENVNYTNDYSNRLLSKGSTIYIYDGAGARISKSEGTDSWTYQYDGESRLTQVLKNGATVSGSAYDGSGMRVKKIEGGKTVYFMYNGNDPILEYSATDAKYTYYIYAGKQSIAEETNGVVKFYHKDHLGSTTVVTDTSGNKVANYTYEPFGKVTAGGDGEQRFTGKEQDAGTGLYYFGARFYDPETGRFITQDPIKAGTNWFIYCINNPLKYIDPMGLDIVKVVTTETTDPDATIITTTFQSDCDPNGDPDGYKADQEKMNNNPDNYLSTRVLINNKTGNSWVSETYAYGNKKGQVKGKEDQQKDAKWTAKYITDLANEIKKGSINRGGFLGLFAEKIIVKIDPKVGIRNTKDILLVTADNIRYSLQANRDQNAAQFANAITVISGIITIGSIVP